MILIKCSNKEDFTDQEIEEFKVEKKDTGIVEIGKIICSAVIGSLFTGVVVHKTTTKKEQIVVDGETKEFSVKELVENFNTLKEKNKNNKELEAKIKKIKEESEIKDGSVKRLTKVISDLLSGNKLEIQKDDEIKDENVKACAAEIEKLMKQNNPKINNIEMEKEKIEQLVKKNNDLGEESEKKIKAANDQIVLPEKEIKKIKKDLEEKMLKDQKIKDLEEKIESLKEENNKLLIPIENNKLNAEKTLEEQVELSKNEKKRLSEENEKYKRKAENSERIIDFLKDCAIYASVDKLQNKSHSEIKQKTLKFFKILLHFSLNQDSVFSSIFAEIESLEINSRNQMRNFLFESGEILDIIEFIKKNKIFKSTGKQKDPKGMKTCDYIEM